ncbi:MAG: protoheme IX farnesyltransferase [Dinghuibacter sp.]|nr:protoheme IX farnesyltransferase [Dinghuibacter sp.]
MKFTLSFTVVFSSVVCYLLYPAVVFQWEPVIWLFIGGMLVTGSANAINQIAEKDTDAQMKRTASRPVAAGRMSVAEASAFATAAGITGVLLMWYFFNWQSALLSAASLFIYAFVYTPLKKVNSISVLVGAVPGALPCLIGWVAGFANDGTGNNWLGGWILFGIQFFWQFPHFWAIAWIAHKDYEKAGFKLLPSERGQTRYSAIQAVIWSLLMLPVGFLPWYYHISGITSMYIVLLANIFMVVQSFRLYSDMNIAAARRVMFSSYIYLPVVLLALLFDKVIG